MYDWFIESLRYGFWSIIALLVAPFFVVLPKWARISLLGIAFLMSVVTAFFRANENSLEIAFWIDVWVVVAIGSGIIFWLEILRREFGSVSRVFEKLSWNFEVYKLFWKNYHRLFLKVMTLNFLFNPYEFLVNGLMSPQFAVQLHKVLILGDLGHTIFYGTLGFIIGVLTLVI